MMEIKDTVSSPIFNLKKIGLVICSVVIYVFGLFYCGTNIFKIIRITVAEHECTKGIPIEFMFTKGATIRYVYFVNGKEYKSEMRTALFCITRKQYTVMYTKANPAVSVLKEHVIASTIQNSILLILLITSLYVLLYCTIKKHWSL